ncbi:MAG: hypothetical protein ABR581_11485 [Thermoleophilaceae bacterium]
MSEALQRAEAAVAASPRSSRSLQSSLATLLSAAGALGNPEATATQRISYGRHLAVGVPGPAGFAAGTFETDTVGRYKGVYWAPDGDSHSTRTLGQQAGRPEGFRYRWQDKRVWEQLAHDMIVVACGWNAYPDRLPPALGRRAAAPLGEQLRRDLGGTSEWAVHAYDIVKWLSRTGLVTLIAPLPELKSVQGGLGTKRA